MNVLKYLAATLKEFGVFLLVLIACSALVYPFRHSTRFHLPVLAAWELAAMIHVIIVAYQVRNFPGHKTLGTRFNKINSFIVYSVLTLVVIAKSCLIVIYMVSIKFVRDESSAKIVDTTEILSAFIIAAPLVFFLINNLFTILFLKISKVGSPDDRHSTEGYLLGLVALVDLPVVIPYLVMLAYIRFFQIVPEQHSLLIVGILGSCLLTVSNVLTGAFDELWKHVKFEV